MWQPIETAPKDGTPILLSNGVDVSFGNWIKEDFSIREIRDIEGRYVDQIENQQEAQWMDWDGGMQPDPTHWMPLPPPPPSV